MFINQTERKYDIVVHDRFTGGALLDHELRLPALAKSDRMITDEFNPLNRLELPIAEAHAAAMNTLLPPAVCCAEPLATDSVSAEPEARAA